MITQHLLNTSRNFKRSVGDSEGRVFIFALATKTGTLTLTNLHIWFKRCFHSPAGVEGAGLGFPRGWGSSPTFSGVQSWLCVSCREPLGSCHGCCCCLVCDGHGSALCSRETMSPPAVQVSQPNTLCIFFPVSVVVSNRLLRPPSFLQMFLWGLMGLVLVVVCMSRVFMAAHFPHQVIAGLFSGLSAAGPENASVHAHFQGPSLAVCQEFWWPRSFPGRSGSTAPA